MAADEHSPADDAAGDAADDELDPDEPRTPLWLPLLGGALFLLAILLFVATRPEGKTASELEATATDTTAPDTEPREPGARKAAAEEAPE